MNFAKLHPLALGFFLLFIVLAVLVAGGYTTTFDEAGVLLFRTPSDPNVPLGGKILATIVSNLTHLGDSIVLAIIAIVAIVILYRKQGAHAAIWLFIAASGSFIITAVSKLAFGRARPDIVDHLVKATSGSFPSGHTLRSAVVYALVAYLLINSRFFMSKKSIITIALSIILINGISRIYLGVHWPTDILGAWLIAVFWLLLTKYGYERTLKKTEKNLP